jgi:hypothetical protein
MRGLTFLFFFILFTRAEGIRRIRTDFLVPYAIKGILDQYHSKNIQDIQILSFGANNGKGEEIVNNFLKLENHSVALRVGKFVPNDDSSSLLLNASSILTFDSFQNARR